MNARRLFLSLTVALGLSAAACSKGSSTIDVEKLPCTERRPTSSFDYPEGYVACMQPTAEIKVGPYTCKKGTTVGVYTKTKTLQECWVAAPTKVGDVSCTGGVNLFPNGTLRRCQLDAELQKNGITMPKGAWITFYEGAGNPRRIELPQGGTIGPYKCKGYMNYVYENGKPKKCELGAEATIEGQAKKVGDNVCFDEAGKLTDCAKLKL